MKNFTLTVALFGLLMVSLVIPLGASSTGWSQTSGGTENDGALSLVQTSDGGYALAGFTRSYGAGEEDFWLIKTDEAGNMQWNQTYGGISSDIASSLVETSDGGYAIAGYTYSVGAVDSDSWLIKTDEQGVIPEFPSWIILPLFLIATLFAIVIKKSVLHPISYEGRRKSCCKTRHIHLYQVAGANTLH
jgi:hypothetical protein